MAHDIALIGCGNMGGAIMRGIAAAQLVDPANMIVSSKTKASQARLATDLGCEGTCDNIGAVTGARCVILAVKPQVLPAIASALAPHVEPGTLAVSIAAGISMTQLEGIFGTDAKLVRAMPNLPAMVGEGMTGVVRGANVTDEELGYVLALFSSFGRAEVIDEHLMDAVVATSGSSPAYVALIVEALADGAVTLGMPRAQAYTFAEQALLGTAKYLQETGMHPGAFKDQVCSPAGTTIAAVNKLEEAGLRTAIVQAMQAAAKRNQELS